MFQINWLLEVNWISNFWLTSLKAGVVDKEADLPPGTFDYDLFVVGGGSGGAAAALEAARRGLSWVSFVPFR